MLKIKLSRIGKKKAPMYRLIISEAARDPYGRALEILGSFNPFSKELKVDADRINHWISKGAQMTASVNNLLIEHDIIKGEKVKTSKLSKKRTAKIEAKEKAANKEKADKETAKAEAEKKAKEAEAKDDEPAEEIKEEAKSEETKEEAKDKKTEDK